MDEIVNHKSVCNFSIDTNTSGFFERNKEFIYLHDKDGDPYEPPTVAYTGCRASMLEFMSVFGTPPSDDINLLMGPYYYFTDYNKAIEQGSWPNKQAKDNMPENIKLDTFDRYDKGGVIRFALFLGNMKVIV